jgi:hypothetical protein
MSVLWMATKHYALVAMVFTLVVGVAAIGAPTAAAEPVDQSTIEYTDQSNTLAPNNSTTTQSECTGSPRMARTSITSPSKTITKDETGLVEANFRVSENVPDDCTVVVDVQFSFAQNGFQFGGGAAWEQSASDIVATEFTLGSGEIRSISAELLTNGATAGDEVTVVADYEIWYEGNRDDSRQVSGIRRTLEVDAPNTETGSSGAGGGGDGPISDLLEFVNENLSFLGMFVIAFTGVVGLIKKKVIVNVLTD